MIVFIYTCVRTYVEYYMFVLIVTLFFCGRIFFFAKETEKKSKNLSTSKREETKIISIEKGQISPVRRRRAHEHARSVIQTESKKVFHHG